MEAYPRTPATGSPLRLIGYADPAYSPSMMFRKSSPPIVPRRDDAPDDRDRPSFEERAQRRDDPGVVSCLHVGGVVRGNGDREGHLHLAALESPRDLEPDTLEDADHRRVVRHHLAHESFDSAWTCERGQSFQHPGRNSSTLVVVGDGKGDLGAPRIAQPHVVRQGDDAVHAVLGHRCEQCSALDPVRVEHRLHEAFVHPRSPVETEVQAARR